LRWQQWQAIRIDGVVQNLTHRFHLALKTGCAALVKVGLTDHHDELLQQHLSEQDP
jgi:hypothetical protein